MPFIFLLDLFFERPLLLYMPLKDDEREPVDLFRPFFEFCYCCFSISMMSLNSRGSSLSAILFGS